MPATPALAHFQSSRRRPLAEQRGRVAFALSGLVWLFSGCDSHDTDEHDPLAEACEHLADGPAKALQAGADDASAVDGSAIHMRMDLSLVDYAGAKGGVVKLAIAEAGDWMVLLSEDVTLSVASPSGAAIAPKASQPGGGTCPSAKVIHTYSLGVGAHLLRFGPGPGASVNVVVEAAADSDH